mmetsp:Transcript_49484/g.120124  ORF Transcript_49484/g.120124 Transcript_49484/m.120124 type:complete len:564 (-) Transcript_49484:3164-4855(-)
MILKTLMRRLLLLLLLGYYCFCLLPSPSQGFHNSHQQQVRWQQRHSTNVDGPFRIPTKCLVPRMDSTTNVLTVTTARKQRRIYAIKSTDLQQQRQQKDEDDDDDDEQNGAESWKSIRRLELVSKFRALTELEERQDQFFFALAVLPSLFAFLLWKDIGLALSNFLGTYGAASQDIDGRFASNLLRPTITGVVVPVIAIGLGTLVSTTINVLRDREVQLRTLINKESCDLHLLRQAVFGLFGTRQHASRRARALALLCSYVKEIEKESSLGAVEALEELQLSGGIADNELKQLTWMLHGIDGAAACREGTVNYADNLIRSLNDYRSERVAELLSGFPAIHWAVLIALSLSVPATFLLVSSQPMNQYLNSFSLRFLFSVLVGVCSGTATICINLADPFRGTFSILDASAQLEELRLLLERDLVEATVEAGEISSSLVHAILLGSKEDGNRINSVIAESSVQQKTGNNTPATMDHQTSDWEKQVKDFVAKKQPRRYGLVQTLYFHLLTGPLGSNVKALGDALAWLSTFVASRTKMISRQVVPWTKALGKKQLTWWPPRNGQSSNPI